jgi:hypothetical protein
VFEVRKQYIYLHRRGMRCSDLRHLSISEFCLPSRNVFRFITLEGDLAVHGSAWTATGLRHHPISADVEFLAVVRVREGGVWQCPSVGANHFALRTRETVVQRLCAERHVTIVTKSDCTLINTRVKTRVNTRWSSTQATVRILPQIWLQPRTFSLPSFPFQIDAACTNSYIILCCIFRVAESVVKRVKQSYHCICREIIHGE